MLSPFLSKLLLGRQLEWSEKGLKILGKDFFVQPLEFLAMLQKELEKIKKEKILYQYAKQDFFKISREMKKYAASKEIFLKYLLALISHAGFGNVEIVSMKEASATLQVKNNKFAETYMKKFGKQKKSVDLILAGMLAGFFSVYFDTSVDCREEGCIAQGKNFCTFLLEKQFKR